MRKVLLVILCLIPTFISAMAAKDDLESADSKKKLKQRRYSSAIYGIPLTGGTENSGDLTEEPIAIEKKLQRINSERGLTQLLLTASKNLSPEVKATFEKNENSLEWQEYLANLKKKEIEEMRREEDERVFEDFKRGAMIQEEVKTRLLENEIRDNLRLMALRKAAFEIFIKSKNKLDRQLLPEGDARLHSGPSQPSQPTISRQWND